MLALKLYVGTSLVVEWLRCHTSTAGGMGLIPSWGTKIPHVVQSGQKRIIYNQRILLPFVVKRICIKHPNYDFLIEHMILEKK